MSEAKPMDAEEKEIKSLGKATHSCQKWHVKLENFDVLLGFSTTIVTIVGHKGSGKSIDSWFKTCFTSTRWRLCESAWSLPAVVGLADCGKMDMLFSITLLCCNIVMQVPRRLSPAASIQGNTKQLMCTVYYGNPSPCEIEFGPNSSKLHAVHDSPCQPSR